jgi:dihydrofolate reductase
MRKIFTGLFTSLDGVVDADDQWQFPYFDEELFQGITAGWERAGATLLGRRSYEGFDALRGEHPDSPAVAFLDAVPKYVVSTTLDDAGWRGTTVLGDRDLREQVIGLKRQPGKDILVLGSPTLVRWLLRESLLDELNLTVLPIIVGSGARLFEDMDMPGGHLGMELGGAKMLASGVLDLTYTPASA